jgi:hypothetical protein
MHLATVFCNGVHVGKPHPKTFSQQIRLGISYLFANFPYWATKWFAHLSPYAAEGFAVPPKQRRPVRSERGGEIMKPNGKTKIW